MAKVILKGHIIVPDSDIAAVKIELTNHIELTSDYGVNNCFQTVFGSHITSSLTIAFKITIIFLTQAMMAIFLGFPAATRR